VTGHDESSKNVRRFEDLWIWQEARQLVRHVYSDIDNQDLGFKWQIQRAAVSIMNNIAEGFEKSSDPEFVRYLDIAKGSCGEVRSMYYVAEDLTYVSSSVGNERREAARRVSAGISSLQKHLRQSTP
jgi:four helix bundle protein